MRKTKPNQSSPVLSRGPSSPGPRAEPSGRSRLLLLVLLVLLLLGGAVGALWWHNRGKLSGQGADSADGKPREQGQEDDQIKGQIDKERQRPQPDRRGVAVRDSEQNQKDGGSEGGSRRAVTVGAGDDVDGVGDDSEEVRGG